MLSLRPDPQLRLSDGDFGAKIEDNCLLIPEDLETALERFGKTHGLVMGEAMVIITTATSFPSELARLLGWSRKEVERAKAKLFEQLRGHVPDEYLAPPPQKTYGVIMKDHK